MNEIVEVSCSVFYLSGELIRSRQQFFWNKKQLTVLHQLYCHCKKMVNPKEASTNLEYVSPSLHGEHERSKINRHEFGVHRSCPQHIAPPRRDPHHILLKLSKEINATRLNETTSVRPWQRSRSRDPHP
jgi:hypothetical protein